MKIRFNRIISFICAVMMICAFCAWAHADETPATPTDLSPAEETVPDAQEPEQEPVEESKEEPEAAPAEKPAEEPAEEPEEAEDTVEVIVATGIKLGESWEGRTRNTKPVVLKLDISRTQDVYMLVEGRNVQVAVQKSDRSDEYVRNVTTDSDTEQALVSWHAETGSYLITIAPEEPNLLAKGKVTFMDASAYQAWEAEQEETESEPAAEPEPETEINPEETENEPIADPENQPEEKPEEEQPVDSLPENNPESETEPEDETEEERSVDITISFGEKGCRIGYPVYFTADMTDYADKNYTLQWQMSKDRHNWTDIVGETSSVLEITLTEENRLNYWRIIVSLQKK